MSGSVFTPNLESAKSQTKPNAEITSEADNVSPNNDSVGSVLLKVAQYSVLIIFGFFTLFFMPGTWATVGFDKSVFAIVLSSSALIALSLLVLRRRQVQTVLPMPLAIFWGMVAVALLSALFSGDIQDALVGSVFGTQTVGFLALMAMVMTITMVLQKSKLMTIKALAVFGATAGILLLYTVVRIIFGGQFLSFGSFSDVTKSPIGSFNDLALFSGLIVILGLITLLQLPLRGLTRLGVASLVYLGLFVLAVVNFFNIWVVVGFFSLLLFVYVLSRDTLFVDDAQRESGQKVSKVLLVTTLLVCIVSAVFIVWGEQAGNKVTSLTDINYIEVRPSLQATLDITKAVYGENIVFGIGPNRFVDAWRLNKDVSINQTIFWDTNFIAGNGYLPTLFVNLGVLGTVLLLLFHGYFLLLGYRMFLTNSLKDSYWYYFGILSFAGAVFLWGMSYVYVPGAGILLLAAVFTGFTFVSYAASTKAVVRTLPLANSRQRGFFLMTATIIVITATIGILMFIIQQHTARATFAQAQATATSVDVLDQAAASAYQLFPDDEFLNLRAQVKLSTLNSLLTNTEPSEEDQQKFVSLAEQTAALAQQAIENDPSNPSNYTVLAGLYSTLSAAGFAEADKRAYTALNSAQQLNPKSPLYDLLRAQIAVRTEDREKAKSNLEASLQLKPNYTPALYLSAQLDIAQGNVESAIATTQAIITLEPNNPSRYFQLGVLLSAQNKTQDAIRAFKAAIARDEQYANARYFLARSYIVNDQPDFALEQLRIVLETNQNNQELKTLIEQLENGETVNLTTPDTEVLPEGETVNTDKNTTVSSSEDLNSNLVTPVNTVSNDSQATEDTQSQDQLQTNEDSEIQAQTQPAAETATEPTS